MAEISRRNLLAAAAALPFAPPARRTAVALVQSEDRRRNVFDALSLVDDQILPLLARKRYVLIKPNCVAVKNQLGSTHADALRGMLDYLAPRFTGPIVIAESSKDETRDAYENFGYERVVSEYRTQRVRLVDLNEEPDYIPHQIIDRDLHLAQVKLAARLFDQNAFLLGAALLKAHDNVVATLSVKNLAMAAPLHSSRRDKTSWHDKYRYHAGYRQMHVNIALTAERMHPFWGATVIDGFEGMEGEGPLNGTPVPSRIAIASTDLVAADRVGVEAMGVNPEWPGYLRYCADMGLGEYNLAKIELRGGVKIEEIRRTYRLHPRIEKQIEWMGPLAP